MFTLQKVLYYNVDVIIVYFILIQWNPHNSVYLCSNFLSGVKDISKFIEIKSNDANDSEDCLLDEENDPIKISEFVTIPSFVVVISCNTSESIYFIKITEKNVAKESMRDRFGNETFGV